MKKIDVDLYPAVIRISCIYDCHYESLLEMYGERMLPKMYFIDFFYTAGVGMLKTRMKKMHIGIIVDIEPQFEPRSYANSLKKILLDEARGSMEGRKNEFIKNYNLIARKFPKVPLIHFKEKLFLKSNLEGFEKLAKGPRLKINRHGYDFRHYDSKIRTP